MYRFSWAATDGQGVTWFWVWSGRLHMSVTSAGWQRWYQRFWEHKDRVHTYKWKRSNSNTTDKKRITEIWAVSPRVWAVYIPEELGNILNTPLQQYTGTPTATEDTPTPPTSPALAASHPPTLQPLLVHLTALPQGLTRGMHCLWAPVQHTKDSMAAINTSQSTLYDWLKSG